MSVLLLWKLGLGEPESIARGPSDLEGFHSITLPAWKVACPAVGNMLSAESSVPPSQPRKPDDWVVAIWDCPSGVLGRLWPCGEDAQIGGAQSARADGSGSALSGVSDAHSP